MSAVDALARFAARTEVKALPPAVVAKAKACLLYAIAVGTAGIRGKQAAQAALATAEGAATRFFDDARCEAGAAAFANGTLFHVRVQDDAHPAGHVGVVVVPAALAMAEISNATSDDLVAALVAGYEVALRIGRDHAADLSTRGFRTTPTYGVFGAAAAAGRLLHLDERAMAHALSLAANMAGGLREYAETGSEDYAFQAGFAAQNGVLAAQLSAAGATSSPSALDGKAGFYRAFGEANRDYASRLADGLGEAFEMLAVTYKPYPICQFHRGIVSGFCALRERAGGTALEAATVRMHPFEADFFGVRYTGPFTTFPQAFMSAPFCAALAWVRGDATLAGLTDFSDGDMLALVPRITIASDPARPRYSPRIELRLADGTAREWEERGAAGAYVLTWETALDMSKQLAAEAGIGADAMRHLQAAAWDASIADIVRAVGPAMREARWHTR